MIEEIEKLNQQLATTQRHLSSLIEVVQCETTDIRNAEMVKIANLTLKELGLQRHPVGAHYKK